MKRIARSLGWVLVISLLSVVAIAGVVLALLGTIVGDKNDEKWIDVCSR